MPIEVLSAESTDLFTGRSDEPLQVVRVSHRGWGPTPELGSGYERPGDPRKPDNTHRH